MKYRKILIILAVFLAVFIIALAYQKIRRAVVENKIDKKQEEQQEQTAVADDEQPIFPLSYGSGMGARSNARQQVQKLQQALNTLVPATYDVDGKWGNNTERCVTLLRNKYPGMLSSNSVSETQLNAIMQEAARTNTTPAELRQTEVREGDNILVRWARAISGWGASITK